MARKTILIVDDDPGIREILADTLTDEGYTVVTAEDGYEAVKKMRELKHFDLCILDIRLPGMDGVATLKMIKETLPQTIAIMITAYSVQDLIDQAMISGAYTCVQKPFDLKEILDLVNKLLRDQNPPIPGPPIPAF